MEYAKKSAQQNSFKTLYFPLQNTALCLSLYDVRFGFLEIFELLFGILLSIFQKVILERFYSWKDSSHIQFWQKMVNCILNGTFLIASVNFSNCFNGILMMYVILKRFLGGLFHGLRTLIFKFLETLIHISRCL